MRLLIVDGSNMVMRAAFGGDVPPDQAVRIATGMVERAVRELEATHLVVALDCPGSPSWRKQLYPEYKAHRTTDTRPWIEAAAREWLRRQWWVEAIDGFEADDIIATMATRAAGRGEVLVYSSDSDLLQLATERICVCKPVNGGGVTAMTVSMICAKHGISTPAALADLKALAGEAGDNVPGVDGIGEVRARMLVAAHGSLEGVIEAGQRAVCKFSAKVAAAAEIARLSYKLVSLVRDVPVVAIKPSDCVFQRTNT